MGCKLAAEALGSLLLAAAVIGSGITGEQLAPGQTVGYVAAQVFGCCMGAILANAMFELPLVQSSTHVRGGAAQWLSEIVATAGLVLVVLGSPSLRAAAWRVPAWIGAAYWFTASTSFANPAITLGRSLTDTFAGIRPIDAPGFIGAQLVGGLIGMLIARVLFRDKPTASVQSG